MPNRQRVFNSPLPTGELRDRYTAFLNDLVYRPGEPAQRRTPGAVLLVDRAEGRFLEAAGLSDLAEGKTTDTADLFEIGSITKLFTTVILLQLDEEGILSLDDLLADWLPNIAATLPHGDQMTLRQLASHTAGLNEYERDLYPMPQLLGESDLLERGFTPEEIVDWVAKNRPPLFAPGAPAAWQYSNTGFILLGMVLEWPRERGYRNSMQSASSSRWVWKVRSCWMACQSADRRCAATMRWTAPMLT
ncbi:MAG: beta-lactamase family protein [Caldilineaceae bacterium]|nr:beta-lactamase family protein [Caldilineaceae bacterium]